MKRHSNGFTIVELIVVIVVIGILATIAMLAYGGYTRSARDNARDKDTKAWIAAFDDYKARFSVYPVLPTNSTTPKTVCLGVFINNKCGQNNSSTSTRYISASGTDYTSVQTEVQRVGDLYANSGSAINGVLAGPIIYVSRSTDSGTIPVTTKFINFFEGNCPSDYTNINSSLPTTIALTLTGQTANACAITKTFSYTPS